MMLSSKGVLVNWKEESRHVAAAGPRVSMESLEWNTSQRTKVAYLSQASVAAVDPSTQDVLWVSGVTKQ